MSTGKIVEEDPVFLDSLDKKAFFSHVIFFFFMWESVVSCFNKSRLLCLDILETKGKVHEVLAKICRNLEIICLASSFALQVVKQAYGRPVLIGKL